MNPNDPMRPKYGEYDAEYQKRLNEAMAADPLRGKTPLPEPTRSHFGIALSLVFLAIAAGLAAVPLTQGGWWHLLWAPVAFFTLFGVAGLSIDVRKVPRDRKGNPL